MKKHFIALIALYLICLLHIPVAQAQTFVKHYQLAPYANRFEDIAILGNGNYVCIGSNNNLGNKAGAIIYSPTGNVIKEWWSDTIIAGRLLFEAVTATSDGSFAAAGGSNASFDIVKFNMQGNVMWHTRIDTFAATGYKPRYCFAVKQTADGGFVATGLAYQVLPGNVSTNAQIYVVKVDEQGNHLWTYQYGGPWFDRANGILVTTDGGVLVTGYSELDSAGTLVPAVIKLNQQGVEEWSRTYHHPLNQQQHITAVETPSGYLIAASIIDTTVNQFAGALVSISTVGDSLSTTYFREAGNSYHFQEIKPTIDGGYIVVGFSLLQNGSSQNALLVKFDDQLQETWQQHIHNSSYSYYATGVCQAADGGYVLSGSTGGAGNIGVLFKTDALGNIAHTMIQGRLVGDANLNCSIDNGEYFLPNHIIEVLADKSYYGYTDTNGFYSISVYDTGQAVVSWASAIGYWAIAPCQNNNFTINLVDGDTIVLDFFAEPLIDCPNLTVQVSTPLLRRCFSNNYTVNYCNNGTLPVANAYIEIAFDKYLDVDSASLAWSGAPLNNTYHFNVGNLGIGQCGSFNVWVTVDCDSTVLGQAHCVEAHIYPDSICLPPSPSWDGSSLKINSQCLPGDTIEFELKNQGNGNMNGPQFYIIVEDNVMYKRGQFQLIAGQSIFERIPGNGRTFTMIVPQSEGHPGKSRPLKSVEGCGTNSQGVFSLGYVTQFPQDDEDKFVDILCLENVGSYDPNDKRPEPLGLGSEGYINATQPLDYTIRFQNTGNDTAFTVVIRDTLSAVLDITTLQINGASHPNTFQIVGSNVLEWTFANILLPDSNVNEPLSHGFVSFSIGQTENNATGTEITNRAGIYFDFNAPIITNTTLNTVVEDYRDKITAVIEVAEGFRTAVKLYPNPNTGRFFIELERPVEGSMKLAVTNLAGREVMLSVLEGQGPHPVSIENLPSGIYIYRITNAKEVVSTGKIIISQQQ